MGDRTAAAVTRFCSRCGRTMKATPRMHAPHCRPPQPMIIKIGTASQRYYWRYQLWRAEHRLSASEALTVRLAYIQWKYELESAADRCAISVHDPAGWGV